MVSVLKMQGIKPFQHCSRLCLKYSRRGSILASYNNGASSWSFGGAASFATNQGHASAILAGGFTKNNTTMYYPSLLLHHRWFADGSNEKKILSWNERYDDLVEYQKEHGHCRLPQSSKDYAGLGQWASRQRGAYKKYQNYEQTPMTKEKIEKLELIGFEWDVTIKTRMKRWNEKYEELVEFQKEHGHCNVPDSTSNNPLGVWVAEQRTNYALFKEEKKGPLWEFQFKKLDEIRFGEHST